MPQLSVDGLRKQIAAKRLEGIYLLVGEDARRVEEAIGLIEGTIDPGDRAFAIDRVHAGEAGGSPIDIADSARVLPMLGDRRIVIVLRAERFLKPKRAGKQPEGAAESTDGTSATSDEPESAVDLAPLEDYLKSPVPSATVVFVAADVDRGRKFTKALLAKANVLEFDGFDAAKPAERADARYAAARQLKEDFQRLGRTIDPKALALLVDRAGTSISKLRDDTERLLLYTEGQQTISRADVDEVVAVEADVDPFAVVNAIENGDVARALRETARRLDQGDNVHAFVGQLRWWVSAKLSFSAPARVKPAIDALLRTDLALKTSGGDERVLVERLVVELTQR